VGEYIPTTSTINSAPRFDHNPTTGESLGLLVEEQRTNQLVQSEDFSTTWPTNSLNVTITSDQSTSPAGTSTADLIVPTTGSAVIHAFRQFSSVTSGTTYTQSIFVKAAGYNVVQIAASTGFDGSGTFYRNFLLSTGQLSANGTISGAITAFPNGWYRISVTAAATSTQSAGRFNINILPSDEATANYNYIGDGTSGVYAWGAQLEAGAFPTSYIPTTTASVTRSADVASITGTAFSSWYRQNEGTVFIEGIMAPNLSRFAPELALSDGTDTNKIEFYNYPSGYGCTVRASGQTNTDPILILSPTSGLPYRKAIALKANDYRVAAQGQQGTSANPSFIPTVNELKVGTSRGGATSIGSTIRRLVFWPRRLGNEVLQEVTR
jgi:hypothetical protein